jgi:putative membrane protein insertion efficiency factor
MHKIFIFWIRIYQNTLGLVFPQSCRFYPSCSEYSIQALKSFGILKGGWLSLKRVLRCNPFNPGGYDPVKKIDSWKER